MPEPRHTVMLLTDNLEVGGAQQTVCLLAGALPAVGCRVVVVAFGGGPLVDEVRATGVPVVVLPGRRHGVVDLPRFVGEARARRRDLLELVEQHDVDVVLTLALGTWEFLAATLVRQVQVWWRIGNVAFTLRREHLARRRWLHRPKRLAQALVRRVAARVVTGVVAVSDETAEAVRREVGDLGGRLVVVRNGVDVARWGGEQDRTTTRQSLGVPATAHVTAMVATMKRQKGHAELLRAARVLVDRRPDWHLVLVGDGAGRDVVAGLVEALGLTGRVHLVGERRDVDAVLAASDSFVLPSLWEGMSVALLEAMACGLPVVATSVSGTTQVIDDGTEGWLVPPGDVDALVRALDELLDDPDRARARGDAARRRIDAEFSAVRCAEQLAALFDGGQGRRPWRRAPASVAVTTREVA